MIKTIITALMDILNLSLPALGCSAGILTVLGVVLKGAKTLFGWFI